MSKIFNKNIPYTFTGSINFTSTSNTIGSIMTTGGNVGIGTIPVIDLHIADQVIDPIIGIQNGVASIFGMQTIGDNGYKLGTYAGGTIANTMFISKNSSVGIGNTSPSYTLHVNGTIAQQSAAASNYSGYLQPNASNQSSSTQLNPGILLFTSNGTFNYGIDLGASGSLFRTRLFAPNTADISFAFAPTAGSTSQSGFTERLVIRGTTGNVGIGTTDPLRALEVRTASNSYGLRHSDGTIRLDTYLGGGINGAYVGTVSQNPLAFMTFDSSPQILLQTNGNVGIGTTVPTQRLDVNGSIAIGNISGTNRMYLGNATTGSARLNLRDVSTNYIEFQFNTTSIGNLNCLSNGTGIVLNAGSANNQLVLSSNGNISIGTTVNNNIGINLPTSGYGIHWGTGFSRIYDDGDLRIATDDNMRFHIGSNTTTPGTEHMTITSSGVQIQTNLYLPTPAGDPAGMMTCRTIPSGQGAAGERTELIIFHSNDNYNNSGPDCITLRAPMIRLQTYDDASVADINNNAGNNERLVIAPNGNVGINTTNPLFTFDVNGTIARSGVKVPRFDNGTFSAVSSFSVPILFNDTQYNYAEIRVRYTISNSNTNMNIRATSYANAAMSLSECALTEVKWNAQNTPVYTTFTGTTQGTFATSVEASGIDNNIIFRIIRSSGTSSTGNRGHYSYDHVFCWAGTGTARGYGQGHIDNPSVGGSQIQFITFFPTSGTATGTYSTVHYY